MISEAIGRIPVGRASTAAAAPARARPEPALGGFARLAANACAAHCASIAIEGQPDVWSSSTAVLPDGAVPARDAFAGYTSRAFGVFEVPDTAADDRFAQSGTAIDGQVVRSYAGCALRNAAGEVLGTLGIYQTTSRFLSQGQRTTLALIADQAIAAIEMQSRLIELSLLSAETSPAAARRPSGAAASALLESAPVAIYHTDAAGSQGDG